MKHSCKVCGKSYPCGRSLGGHMRSHLSGSTSSTSGRSCFMGLGPGYGLRENPKKTRRLLGEEEEVQEEEQEQEPMGHERKRSRLVASIRASSSSDCGFDKEEEDIALSLVMLSRDTGFWGAVEESSDKNSVVLEDKGDASKKESDLDCDPNEIGMSSKLESDVSGDGLVEVDDSKQPKTNSFGTDEAEGSNEASKKHPFKKKNLNSCVAEFEVKRETYQCYQEVGKFSSRKRERSAANGDFKYKCATCNKSFHSYQALGGHRASQKRINGCCASKTDHRDNSMDTGASFESTPIKEMVDKNRSNQKSYENSRKAKGHQCPICYKVFSSGQALGGHKRSHLMSRSDNAEVSASHHTSEVQQQSPKLPDLLDLNLPASVDEDLSNTDDNAEFKSWWTPSNCKNESLVGLIPN
ncbi:zinc finger protein ZAT9-like isoform X1 [Typha angustifolia]|uniref:zinc finger protein ZAT9-like isoform X1 n=1 Tax=Typha angustifolia TaxID=59011 RepID=UPI003C2ABF00